MNEAQGTQLIDAVFQIQEQLLKMEMQGQWILGTLTALVIVQYLALLTLVGVWWLGMNPR